MLDSLQKLYGRIFPPPGSGHSQNIEGKVVYRVLVLGHSSPLTYRCIEDVLLSAANEAGIGLAFVDTDNCDLCVLSSDELLGRKFAGLYERIRQIRAPVVAFGLGTEGDLHAFSRYEQKQLKNMLRQI